MTRTCLDCPTTVTRYSKTGRCRACAMRHLVSDPAVQMRRVEAYKASVATPESRAKRSAKAHERYARPGEREKLSVAAKRALENNPELLAKRARNLAVWQANNPDFDWSTRRRAAAAAFRARVPDGYWDEYQKIRKKVGAAEAKRLIAEQAAADERARLAALTPFERQMDRVRAGARLIEIGPIRAASPTMTLGGVSTGML